MLKNNLLADQGGAVALFTTILISMLLIIITLSLITLQTLQLRKSEDAEQTLRAYYTAEAGVEDAVSKVLAKVITGDQVCSDPGASNTNYDTVGDSGWTCQQVTFSGAPSGLLGAPDQAVTVDPYPIGPPTWKALLVFWNTQQVPKPATTAIPGFAGGNAPTEASFNYNLAPLELSVLEYPSGGFAANKVCNTFSGGVWTPAGCTVTLQNLLLYPGGNSVPVDVRYDQGLSGLGPVPGNCGVLGRTGPLSSGPMQYNCWALISHITDPNTDFLFRIRSRYVASSYKMLFCVAASGANCGTNNVNVPDGTATIDVTARSGQTYRRVISKLPLNQGAASGLNYVMYSDTDICKNFSVVNNVAQTPYPCP
jgi:hypothetical protein